MKKNIIAIMMAIVALFATQCKKQTEPMTNQPAGETMKVTVRVENNTAKTGITATGAVTWKEGDKLYVVGSEQGLLGYVSALTNGKSVNFEGSIIPLNAESQKLRFYYVGDKKFILDGEGNYTFDLSAQDGTLEGIAAHNQLMFGTTSENIAAGTTNFGTIQMTSLMAIAHLKFIFPSEGNKTINADDVVMVTDGYATSTFNAKNYGGTSSITGTKGTITMTSSSPITECYIALLPGEQTLSFTYNNAMYSGSLDEEDVVANKFYNSENPIEVECKPNTPDGTLSGIFTVNSSGLKVYFSIGNLQYLAKGGDAGDASGTAASGYSVGGTWRFALNQYDSQGTNNNNPSYSSEYWIDMFCWSSTGYNHNPKGYYQPWESSTGGTYNAYGNANNNLTGIADWGYNKISNGGNAENSGWRTLSQTEWNYLVNKREINKKTGFGKTCQYVSYNEVKGLIIYPDNYSGTMYDSGEALTSSTFPNGCVFLPCSGYRNGSSGIVSPNEGHYWTTTCKLGYTQAYYFLFTTSGSNANNTVNKGQGRNVRLVRNVPAN